MDCGRGTKATLDCCDRDRHALSFAADFGQSVERPVVTALETAPISADSVVVAADVAERCAAAALVAALVGAGWCDFGPSVGFESFAAADWFAVVVVANPGSCSLHSV